jgi:uncharacterized membrane protein
MDVYGWLKFVHLASVVLWVGGAFSIAVLIMRATRVHDRTLLASLLRHAAFYGRAIVGPVSALALISGFAMLGVLGISAEALWVRWGMAGFLGHFVLGAFFIRRATGRLAEAAAAPDSLEPALASARRRLGVLNALYFSLLLSVVWAMATKPML